MPSELSADDILVQVVERRRRAFVQLPDLRVSERPGWLQLVTLARLGFTTVCTFTSYTNDP